MHILITGGGGFLGAGMALPLAQAGHQLRLLEPRAIQSPHEVYQGDVTSLQDVKNALTGMDAVIINHMAPRQPNAYATPQACFDINVHGSANVFLAAVECGVKKIVQISTTGSVHPPEDPTSWLETIPQPVPSQGLYQLTKACQETIAKSFAADNPLQVSVLRIGYIVDAEQMKDKYGRDITERAPLDTDRRDVGEVARLCLERDDINLEVFTVMSTHEALSLWGVQMTVDRLGWKPRYDFERLPSPQTKKQPTKS